MLTGAVGKGDSEDDENDLKHYLDGEPLRSSAPFYRRGYSHPCSRRTQKPKCDLFLSHNHKYEALKFQ